jgi:hypothetical protein
MTDEMMSLRTLLEKSADADLLREMVGFVRPAASHNFRQHRPRLW